MLAVLTYATLALCGTIWGMREHFHTNPHTFEILFGREIKGFWGSLGWTRKYKFYPIDNRPRNPVLYFFPYNDFWHLAWYAVFGLLITGVILAQQIRPEWYWTAAIVCSTHVFHASLSYRIIENRVKKQKQNERIRIIREQQN